MLSMIVGGEEYTIELPDGGIEFLVVGGYNLELEHSLVSLSKWESKYKKPFLTEDEKTHEEVFYYLKCMVVSPNVPHELLKTLSEEQFKQINEYINDKMTATFFNEVGPAKRSSKVITNELIYYWMSALQLDLEMQYWHLNRLFTAIKVASLESQPPKKMNNSEAMAQQRRLNEERRKQYESQG